MISVVAYRSGFQSPELGHYCYPQLPGAVNMNSSSSQCLPGFHLPNKPGNWDLQFLHPGANDTTLGPRGWAFLAFKVWQLLGTLVNISSNS